MEKKGRCQANLGTGYIMLPSWRTAGSHIKGARRGCRKVPSATVQLSSTLTAEEPALGSSSSAKGYSC